MGKINERKDLAEIVWTAGPPDDRQDWTGTKGERRGSNRLVSDVDDEKGARLIYMGATYLSCYRGGDLGGAGDGERIRR